MTSTTYCGNTLKNHIEKIQRKSHQENSGKVHDFCAVTVQRRKLVTVKKTQNSKKIINLHAPKKIHEKEK